MLCGKFVHGENQVFYNLIWVRPEPKILAKPSHFDRILIIMYTRCKEAKGQSKGDLCNLFSCVHCRDKLLITGWKLPSHNSLFSSGKLGDRRETGLILSYYFLYHGALVLNALGKDRNQEEEIGSMYGLGI